MNFLRLLAQPGKVLEQFQVNQSIDGCHVTLTAHARYECTKCRRKETWEYRFYCWRMPTHTHELFNFQLSCYEKARVNSTDNQ